jgi:hypothetical protein
MTINCPEKVIPIIGGATLRVNGGFKLCCVGRTCEKYPCSAVKCGENKIPRSFVNRDALKLTPIDTRERPGMATGAACSFLFDLMHLRRNKKVEK